MKHYNLIKSFAILFLLFQVFSVIGQLGYLVTSLQYLNGSLDTLGGLGIGLLFIAATAAIVYFCILKIDKILKFFNIHKLFPDEDTSTVELPELNARWISLILISVGIVILFPSLLDILTQGLKKIQSGIYNNSSTVTLLGELDPTRFNINILESIFGLLLITQSKYLGKWIAKKVIDEVKLED